MDYKSTIQLPKTAFPMKANLAQQEPAFLARWEKSDLYGQIQKKGKGREAFVLHDGPPYANGNIHLGHVMNKTLKDIVVKSKTMLGYASPYLPGWDCHGLPIELQVVKKLGSKARNLSKLELRQECRKYAERFIDVQREEFKRLGIFGEWSTPYLTMNFAYEAAIAREFGKVVEKGYVYRKRKPIHWCISCRTALAEAEIEYGDHTSPSIYVSYPIKKGWEEVGLPDTDPKNRFAMIWTTTPWTLPASMAIAYHPKYEYVVVEKKGEPARYLVAKDLVSSIEKAFGIQLQIVAHVKKGSNLSGMTAHHPFLDRKVPLLPGEHVTLETGTGLVHTAPGHGEEDYALGLTHKIEVYSPLEPDGRFEKEVPHFAGLKVFEANPKIIEHLKNVGRLFEKDLEVQHAYPHCWRCKKPVIFRATAQWFLSMEHEDLRKRSLEEIDRVRWVPKWGRERIHGMVENRPDWCLSRQRVWGVPVIAFVCAGCDENFLSAAAVESVAKHFDKEGADAWYRLEVKDLISKDTKCPKCGKKEFEKGSDILDVWFDSGASHAAVLEQNDHLGWPCEMYLEGSDQHRGWFHSSLLESVATRGKAPFKTVLTHGFVVDGKGKKMSKSLGNYVSAQELMKQKGAEMLRFWVATEDYRDDVRLSNEIMDRVVESYRRIRNTARFCLGNLADFQPDRHSVPREKLAREVDRFALDRLARVTDRLKKAYENYDFHLVAQALNEFCVVDLSSRYLDLSKDLLYCDRADGNRRRSAQTILFETAKSLALFLAPILPMTSEEIWDHLPEHKGKASSVHLSEFPAPFATENADFVHRWEKLFDVRGEVSKALEIQRKNKVIGQSLEAYVEVHAPTEYASLLTEIEKDLPMLWIVSQAKPVAKLSSDLELFESGEIEGLRVGSKKISSPRCERCWTFATDLGKDKNHPKLCGRCTDVVTNG